MIDAQKVKQRREALGWSQDRLATEAGVSQTTIDKIERGLTKRSRFIYAIAGALESAPQDLDDELAMGPAVRTAFKAMNRPDIRDRIPVFVAAEGGPGNLIVNKEPMEMIQRPEQIALVPDAYAVYIVGESMFPEFEPGDRVIVDPQLPPIGDVPCIFYTRADPNDRATIKRLVRATEKAWQVEQWNPQNRFELSREEWPVAHRVIGKWSRR